MIENRLIQYLSARFDLDQFDHLDSYYIQRNLYRLIENQRDLTSKNYIQMCEQGFGIMKKLLMATDLSARSDRALERAVLLAKEKNAQLNLLRRLSPRESTIWSMPTMFPSKASFMERIPEKKCAISIKRKCVQ